MTREIGALTTLVGLLVVTPASANPIDLFGFGARTPALGNASVATGDTLSAPFTNAAACARSGGLQLGIGYGYGAIALRRNRRDEDLQDYHGTDLGICVPSRLGKIGLGFGAAAHFPDQWILRIAIEPASQGRFVLWANRPHRTAFNPTVALSFGNVLAVGGGMTMLADGAGNGVNFRVGYQAGRVIAESALDVELPTRAAPVAAVLLTPRDDLRLGARYSGELSLDLSLDVLSQVDVPGTPLGGDALISLRGVDHYTPEQFAFGASAGPLGGWTLSTEIVWSRWSKMDRASSDVALMVAIGVTPSILQALEPPPGFSDSWSPRIGIEREVALGSRTTLALRGGYRFEPSPVPDQTGLTSYMDNDRHVVSAGVGLRRSLPGASAVTLDAALAWQHLAPRTTHKRIITSPGGDFSSDGEVLAAMAMTGVEF